jgi:DNA-binding NarL/FixJ family response regulator
MASSYKTLHDNLENAAFHKPKHSILIIDSDDLSLCKNKTNLRQSGFKDVEVHTQIASAQSSVDERYCDLVFLEIPSGEEAERRFEFISWLRARKFRGITVVLSNRPTIPMIYRAAMLGANELMVKSPAMNLVDETIRLFDKRQMNDCSLWHPEAFLNSGVFRCMSLSKGELEVLKAFADGFPRHIEIARRLGKNCTYIRKTFSRIYEKVGFFIPVENPAQLSHLITVCSLFQ